MGAVAGARSLTTTFMGRADRADIAALPPACDRLYRGRAGRRRGGAADPLERCPSGRSDGHMLIGRRDGQGGALADDELG